MNRTSDGGAFRAQLVVPEHRQLFDYWLHCCGGRRVPCRGDIKPSQIPRLLPGISLIDVAEDLAKSTVRLAGTRLREIHDREITGLTVEALEWGNKHEYWLAAYRRTVEQGEPTQGVLKGPRVQKDHMVQYWLRLPISREGNGSVDMVLGHDFFAPAAEQVEDMRQIA
jgi:PAS domain